MAFDAGTIEAQLTVKTDQLGRDLDAAKIKVKAFEDEKHEVKITAVFDTNSVSKARQMFAQLDQSLSRDAMSRLRTSPQGSVLGALNALFSPHPVTGAPSAQQAAQNGLLGKMVSGAGGGTGQTTSKQNVIKQVIGVDDDAAKEAGAKAGKDAADAASNAAQAEITKRKGIGALIAAALPSLSGGGGGGGSAKAPPTPSESGGTAGFAKNLAEGIGPGILGTSFKTSTIAGLLGSALGAVPALGAIGAGTGAIAGGALTLFKTNDQLQKQGKQLVDSLGKIFTDAAQPMVKPLSDAISSIGKTMQTLAPEFKAVFSAAAPLIKPLTDGLEGLVKGLLPGLVAILKAAQPAFQVFSQFIAGIGKGLGQMFQAFSTVIGPSSVLLKALLDVVLSLFPTLANLGVTMATALGPAFVAFGAAIRALMPFLDTVAKIFSEFAGAVLTDLSAGLQLVASILKAVAPAFNTLATALGEVFNTLESKGGFAQLGNVLESLATPIGNLIKSLIDGLAPAIPPLLTLFSDMVNILSSVGVQVLNALIPPLTKLAEMALGAIMKVLPVVVPLITKFLAAFTEDAARIILAIAVPLANLAEVVLTKLLIAAEPLVPVIVALLDAFTPLINVLSAVFVRIISDLAQALNAVITAIPPGAIQALAIGIGAVVLGIKAWAVAQAVLDIALNASTIGLIITAVALLAVGIVELVDHWSTVWGAITAASLTAWHAIYDTVLSPLINWFTVSLPQGLDTAWSHVQGWWADVENAFVTAWQAVYSNVLAPIGTFFTVTLPGWFSTAINFLRDNFATPFLTVLSANWNAVVAGAGAIRNFFTVTLPGWWDAGYHAIVTTGENVINWFKSLPGNILSAVSSLAASLRNFGASVLNGFLDGIKSVWDSVINFFKNLPGEILGALGIHSPPDWAVNAGKWIMKGIGLGMDKAKSVVSDITKWIQDNVKTYSLSASASSVMSLMKSMAAARGWTGSQWTALNALEMAEAGYNLNAQNPTSNAYGIAQFINGPGEYATYGGNANTAQGQVTAMLNYIAQRYGSPAAAWDHENAFHWYGDGGPINEPVLGYGVNTGRGYVLGERGPEWVVPQSQMREMSARGSGGSADIVSRLDRLIDVTAQVPAGVGRHVGGAISGATSEAAHRNRYPQGGW